MSPTYAFPAAEHARAVGRRIVAETALRLRGAPGRLDPRQHELPTFLIAGAQRCGTTSLFRALTAHPAVMESSRREVHYFDLNYDRGPQWYRSHFPSHAAADRRSTAVAEPVQIGESSPYYLFHPAVPQRIARDLPAAKIVVLIRDPVERAVSAHRHEVQHGYEREPLGRALELEAARTEGEPERLLADPAARSYAWQHYAYIARGKYVEQLVRLCDAVDRPRVMVVDAHDFFVDPMPVFTKVLAFLGLSAGKPRSFDRHNAAPRLPVDDQVRERLSEEFEGSDRALATFLGWTPSWMR